MTFMDFDEARKEKEQEDRSFVIGGETFTYRVAVAPEEFVRWNEVVVGDVTVTDAQWLERLDEIILVMLEPGQEKKWKKVRALDAKHPLTISDIKAVQRYLIEQVTGRPTGGPSGSSTGGSATRTPSREGSSSKAAAPSAV